MNEKYLAPTYFLNFDEPSVQEFAELHAQGANTAREISVQLFRYIRDRYPYNPYDLNFNPEAMRVSELIKRESAYCNEKAMILAACLRYHKIPSRLYFGNVRNHIATEKLQQILQTDVMAFHGCTEVYLDGKWIKATPAFNTSLCERLGVEPLEFDGYEDSIFQEFSTDGRKFMDYIKIHGSFDDMPHDLFLKELRELYGHLIKEGQFHYKINPNSLT